MHYPHHKPPYPPIRSTRSSFSCRLYTDLACLAFCVRTLRRQIYTQPDDELSARDHTHSTMCILRLIPARLVALLNVLSQVLRLTVRVSKVDRSVLFSETDRGKCL